MPQERRLSVLPLLARYGGGVVDAALRALDEHARGGGGGGELWPAAARHLLASLPVDAPVLAFLDTHVAGPRLFASPAIASSV